MTATIQSSAYSAVSTNEVGGKAAKADSIQPPVTSTSGWTIGFNQQDFSSNSTVAKQKLTNALVASGQFTTTEANAIGSKITAAGTSSTLSLSGITDVNGNAVTVTSIDNALQTSAAATSIYNSSQTAFNAEYNELNTQVFQATDLDSPVQSALNDPTYGALLKTVLADYDNQYNISAGQSMDNLLTNGTTSFTNAQGSVATVTINSTDSAEVVTEKVMSAELDTNWANRA